MINLVQGGIMLVALLPNQVSEYWPLLKGHIEDSLPPTGDWGAYSMNDILSNILAGYAQVWLYNNEEHINQGFVVTAVYNDISGVKTLIIYCIVVIDKSAKVDWEKEFNTLKKFALSRGCSKIGAYVMNEKILEKVKDFEVDTRFVFAHINI